MTKPGVLKKHVSSLDDVAKDGSFVRKPTQFRNWIKADGSTPYPPEAGRYHLFVSLACPWAHRTLITRALKGLEDTIDVTAVHWHMDELGWRFATDKDDDELVLPGAFRPDPVNGFERMRELYFSVNPEYDGRVTVPCLYDTKTKQIVNNESSEIIEMFNREFDAFATKSPGDLSPEDLQDEMEQVNEWIYPNINNGVYRCGFAKGQEAFERAYTDLFGALDRLEEHLKTKRFLCGSPSRLTLSDIRLFTTLVRFDAVYVTHFKTNNKRIVDYPNILNYLRDLYQREAFRNTTDMEHIKKHYFASHKSINPFSIVPPGPSMEYLNESHNRDNLS